VTDAALRRVDQILTELIETVETARAVPMSSSCVVPRERMLDLFDDLREVLPPEMVEARKLIAQRETILEESRAEADRRRQEAGQAADAVVADAQHQVADLHQRADDRAREVIEAAEAQARELLEAARAEHHRLVSATGIHQAASEAAAALRLGAEEQVARLRAESEAAAGHLAADAEAYSSRLHGDADAYVQRTLSDLLDVLQRAARTTEQGLQRMSGQHAGEDR